MHSVNRQEKSPNKVLVETIGGYSGVSTVCYKRNNFCVPSLSIWNWGPIYYLIMIIVLRPPFKSDEVSSMNEMAQRLRALTALVEETSSIPSPGWWLRPAYNASPTRSNVNKLLKSETSMPIYCLSISHCSL